MKNDMELIDFEDTLNEDIGPVGTPARNKLEKDVQEAVRMSQLAEIVKAKRNEQNGTQKYPSRKRKNNRW